MMYIKAKCIDDDIELSNTGLFYLPIETSIKYTDVENYKVEKSMYTYSKDELEIWKQLLSYNIEFLKGKKASTWFTSGIHEETTLIVDELVEMNKKGWYTPTLNSFFSNNMIVSIIFIRVKQIMLDGTEARVAKSLQELYPSSTQ